MANNPIELLITLGVSSQSKTNIQNYIDKLKLENLDVTLNIESGKLNNKVFSDMEKQIKSLQSQVQSLNKQLSEVGDSPSSSFSISKNLSQDLNKATEEFRRFLITQKGYQNFDIKVNADTSNGETKLKSFVATIKDVNDEVRKMTFTVDKDSLKNAELKFNQIRENVKDANFRDLNSSLIQVNKTLDDAERQAKLSANEIKRMREEIDRIQFSDFELDKSGSLNRLNEQIKETTRSSAQLDKATDNFHSLFNTVKRSGLISTKILHDFQDKVEKINASDITLDKKIVELRQQLSLLNNQFDIAKSEKHFEDSTKRIGIQVQNLESDFRRLINTYRKETKNLDLSPIENEIRALKNAPQFTNQAEIDAYSEKINKAKANLKEFSSSLITGARNSLTFSQAFGTAIEKFTIWMGASTLFFSFFKTSRAFIDSLIDIDTKLTNISKVLSDDVNIAEVFDRATISAQTFGKSISEALDAYTEFARQGFKGEDLGYLADAGLVAANVGELDAQKASEYMTASMVQWNIEAEKSMGIIDSWNAISNNYATTVEKLAEGQTRAGATARSMGLDFNQLNAVIGK